MTKVLFLDIDGVLLPSRAYVLPNQTSNPYVTVFDPCSVALLNKAVQKQDRKIVVHSSWVKHNTKEWIKNHLQEQGVNIEYLHEDWFTLAELSWRYDRVAEWLKRHPEVDDFFILDDEPEGKVEKYKDHLILTDFDEGITWKIYRRISDGTAKIKLDKTV